MTGAELWRDYHWECLWPAFAAVNVAAMMLVPGQETLPFHAVWISLIAMTTVRGGSLPVMAAFFGAAVTATGSALLAAERSGTIAWIETTHLPMMMTLFIVTAWHTFRLHLAARTMTDLALQDMDRRRRQHELLSDVSHEVRHRVAVAQAQAELLSVNSSASRTAEHAAMVLAEMTAVSRLTDRLLELDRLRPEVLIHSMVDVPQLLDEVVERWSARVDRQWNLQITSTDTLWADKSRLESALDALIENAVDFTIAGSSIRVGAEAGNGTTVFYVTDSGSGVPPDVLPHVFERHYSNRPDTIEVRIGNGLGLAIVRRVAEAHGGSVAVESIVGVGSRFELVIPQQSTALASLAIPVLAASVATVSPAPDH